MNLTDQFLIAMAEHGRSELRWDGRLTCASTAKRGALGLVINRPTDLTLARLFDKIDLRLENRAVARRARVLWRSGADRARLRSAPRPPRQLQFGR